MIQIPAHSVTPRSRTIELTDDDLPDDVVEVSPKKPLYTKKQHKLEEVLPVLKPVSSDRFFRRDGTYISLADKEEIHHEKVVAAWWSAVPVLGGIFALCSWVGEFINKPESNASHRVDYQLGKRSYQSAIDQETRLKDSRNKVRFTTVFTDAYLTYLLTLAGIPFIGTAIITSLLTLSIPIAYQTGEHPELNTFNQGL
jgi:hypothetical protein